MVSSPTALRSFDRLSEDEEGGVAAVLGMGKGTRRRGVVGRVGLVEKENQIELVT